MKIEIQKLFIATKLKFVSRKPNNKLSPTEQWCLKTLGVYHGVPHHGDNHPNSQHYQVLSRRISTILCEKDVYPKVAMCCHGKWWWTILGRPIFRPISQHPSWNGAIGTVDCFEFDKAIDLWQQHQQRDFSITQWNVSQHVYACVRMHACYYISMLLYNVGAP